MITELSKYVFTAFELFIILEYYSIHIMYPLIDCLCLRHCVSPPLTMLFVILLSLSLSYTVGSGSIYIHLTEAPDFLVAVA